MASYWFPAELQKLLLTWVVGEPQKARRKSGYMEVGRANRVVQVRLVELLGRVARGEAGPMLACPTHEHGWIDPRVLVARLGRHVEAD